MSLLLTRNKSLLIGMEEESFYVSYLLFGGLLGYLGA
jgi:hypothetical protein